MKTLREFVDNELPFGPEHGHLSDGEIVTDAVLIYRAVKVHQDGEVVERAGYVMSTTCGKLMAKGLLSDVEEQWGMDYAEQYFGDKDKDEGGLDD